MLRFEVEQPFGAVEGLGSPVANCDRIHMGRSSPARPRSARRSDPARSTQRKRALIRAIFSVVPGADGVCNWWATLVAGAVPTDRSRQRDH